MENQTNNNCLNCKFYSQHYVKFKSRFKKVKGRCINCCVSEKSFDRRFFGKEACPLWQSNENQPREERQNVISALCKMSENLEQIREILENRD